ncbi:MAG: hypothetical protein V3S11_01200 [Elusimicrobiota bacterium]
MRAGLILVVAILAAAGFSTAARGEALRDAAHAAIALRRARTHEASRAALNHAFDASPLRRSPPTAAKGRYWERSPRFLQRIPPDLRDALRSMPDLKVVPELPGFNERLAAALRRAVVPLRTLLDIAWGGSWRDVVTGPFTGAANAGGRS